MDSPPERVRDVLTHPAKKPAEPAAFEPRATGKAQAWLSEIGLPEKQPFRPDPFQIEALELVQAHDVLVSAPTGAGKTWIAREAMAQVLSRGGRAWYASPLKALSNAKLLEFSDYFGPDKVGILTGDRKENPQAPIIVGTTEILRNQLYDAMAQGEDLRADLVVLDEAHYLADPERGVVWEEVIIYLPPRIRLLLLSATLANAQELAAWLEDVRKSPCRVVEATERPVPLAALVLSPDGLVLPLLDQGRMGRQVAHLLGKKNWTERLDLDRVLTALEELDLLPAIFFLTSRADCDRALAFGRQKLGRRWSQNLPALRRTVDQFLADFPFLGDSKIINYIRRFAVAPHHAGMLPHAKLVVEKLMQAGLLRAIFSTSTVAAGVNFPARTVVLSQSDRFNGRDFVELTATELHQMTGRAGRRGMDKVGFVLLTPGPHQDLSLVADLLQAPPEPIVSQMQLNFSMLLNLLLSHTPDQIRPILNLSLAAFQSAGRAAVSRPKYLDKLAERLRRAACGEAAQAVLLRRRRRQMTAELARLLEAWPDLQERLHLMTRIVPGRVFQDSRGRFWAVKRPVFDAVREGAIVVQIDKKIKLSHGKLRTKFIATHKINKIFDFISPSRPDKAWAAELHSLSGRKFDPISEHIELSPEALGILAESRDRIDRLQKSLSQLPCSDCLLGSKCQAEEKNDLGQMLDQAENWYTHLAEERHRLWLKFLSHLDFLKAEGFCGPDGRLIAEGRWASQLRLDHPLLIAEAIRRRALPEESPALLAALMGPFVLDRERAWPASLEKINPEPEVSAAFLRLETEIAPLLRRQQEAGFPTPHLRFAPALALFRWANGRAWEEVTRTFQVEPGDLASLVFRTADNLRQIASLEQTHPLLAATAWAAQGLILRSPVLVPT